MLDALRIIRLASRILAPRPPFRFVAKCVPSSVYARLDLDRLLQQRQRLVGGLGHRDRNIGKGARVEPRHWHMLRTARLVTIAFGDGSGPQHVDCLIMPAMIGAHLSSARPYFQTNRATLPVTIFELATHPRLIDTWAGKCHFRNLAVTPPAPQPAAPAILPCEKGWPTAC